jgi:hypothetical protein
MPANLKPILYAVGGALAAVLVTTTTALAGSGVGGVFNLGELNTVNAQTSLSGNAGGNPQLRVENGATVQNAFGVLGRITAGLPAGQTAGVRGINSGTNANGFGVWGFHQGSGAGVFGETGAGIGVLGRHTSSTGTAPGVRGETASAAPDAAGVFGTVTAATPGADSAGVRGTTAADDGYGVFGENTGTGFNPVGVFGKSGGGAGILGEGTRSGASLFSNGSGVYACATPTGSTSGCNTVPPFGNAFGGQFYSCGSLGTVPSSACTTTTGVYGCGGNECSAAFGHPFGGQFTASGEFAVGVSGFAFGGSNTVGIRGRAEGTGSVGGQFSSSGGLAGRFVGELHTTGRITKAYTPDTSSQAVPIAYGTLRATDGVLLSGTPNVSTSYDSVNKRYLITIAGETYATASYITSVTPTASLPRFATTTATSGKLAVRIFDHNGALQQTQFSFVTYKP